MQKGMCRWDTCYDRWIYPEYQHDPEHMFSSLRKVADEFSVFYGSDDYIAWFENDRDKIKEIAYKRLEKYNK